MAKCSQCGNYLEEDSKFCTNCGEKIADKKLEVMHAEKTSSKVKIYVLKVTAFVLAMVITMIVKTMLMSAGLLEVSGDFMKSGMFLFLGLWLLFSGLFLKNNKKKYWGYGLLTFYVVGSIGFGYFANNSLWGIDRQIYNTMKSTPIKIDESLELSEVTSSQNNVNFKVKLLNIAKSDMSNEDKYYEASDLCKTDEYKKMMDYGKVITISLYGRNDNLLEETVISKSICGIQ